MVKIILQIVTISAFLLLYSMCVNNDSIVKNPILDIASIDILKKNEKNEIIETSSKSALNDKDIVFVYISASWCPPCKKFTPELVSFYQLMKKKTKKLEVLWISKDHSIDEYYNYFDKMPWLAVQINHLENATSLVSQYCSTNGIPLLAVFDNIDGSLISCDGVSLVMNDRYGIEYPWRPRSILSLVPKPIRRLMGYQIAAIQNKLMSYMSNEAILNSFQKLFKFGISLALSTTLKILRYEIHLIENILQLLDVRR